MPPLKLVGEGSSRVCYAFTGGKCLKIAKSLAGIAQNKQEYESTSASGAVSEFSDIFAQTYDKNNDFGVLLSECCTPLGPDDNDVLAKFFDVSAFYIIVEILDFANEIAKSYDFGVLASKMQKLLDDYKPHLSIYEMKSHREKKVFFETLRDVPFKSLHPGMKAIYRLFEFWKKYGKDSLDWGDLINCQNWGLAIRYGQIQPVVVDAGLSSDIRNKYYRR